jgi:hypothetical protein
MAKKRQTRRSISLRAEVYATLAAHCASIGVPVSAFVEEAAMARAASEGARLIPRDEAITVKASARAERQAEADRRASTIFTF